VEICGQTIQWMPLFCGKAVTEPSASRITRIAVAILGLLMVGGGLSMVFGMSGWTGLIPTGWSIGGVGVVATLCALAFRCIPAVPPISFENEAPASLPDSATVTPSAVAPEVQSSPPNMEVHDPKGIRRFRGEDDKDALAYYLRRMQEYPDGSRTKVDIGTYEAWLWKENGKAAYFYQKSLTHMSPDVGRALNECLRRCNNLIPIIAVDDYAIRRYSKPVGGNASELELCGVEVYYKEQMSRFGHGSYTWVEVGLVTLYVWVKNGCVKACQYHTQVGLTQGAAKDLENELADCTNFIEIIN
jgi:hypothetical protein